MPINCPKCRTELPQHGDLEYRYCPRCGTEIIKAESQSVDDFQTIPPDFNDKGDPEQQDIPEFGTNPSHSDGFLDQSLEPQISSQDPKRPAIKPPAGPAPTSFYRSKKKPDK